MEFRCRLVSWLLVVLLAGGLSSVGFAQTPSGDSVATPAPTQASDSSTSVAETELKSMISLKRASPI